MMKTSVLLLIYLNLVALNAVVAVDEYSCLPDTDGLCVTLPSNTTIFLSKASNQELLTITRATNGKELVPIGRSYHQNNWERVAGPYDTLIFDCSVGNDLCQVTIPETTAINQNFRLSRFEHRLPIKDSVARFLEQATFGTKPDELNDLNELVTKNDNDLDKTFGFWVEKQIDQIPPTSHREFFRRRVAPRYKNRSPVPEGKIAHPCSSGARWRRFSFTMPDLYSQVLITKVSNRYALSIDGHIRTMLDDILFQDSDVLFEYTEPTSYLLCAIGRAQTFINFGIKYKKRCQRLVIGNPPVDISGIDPQPDYVLDAVDPASFITKVDFRDTTKIEGMLSIEDMFDNYSSLCESMSLEYTTPIFAQLTNGQVLLYDPMLEFETNTLENPLNDGGGLTTVSTEQKSQCINVPRTFLNDADCRLSSVATCTSMNTLDLSLELNEENLRELYHKTGRYYYAVQGLRLNETEANWGMKSPCQESSRSRWVIMENNDCEQNVENSTAGKSCLSYTV
jgi:hypothetical protein